MIEQIRSTFVDLTAIDAPSKNEGAISDYVIGRLEKIGLGVSKDQKDNVLGFLPGQGEPILLNAHLEGFYPGKDILQ